MINYAAMFDDKLPEPEAIISDERMEEVASLLINTFRMNAGIYGTNISYVDIEQQKELNNFETFIIPEYEFDSLAEKLLRIRKPDVVHIYKIIEPVISDDDSSEFKFIIKVKTINLTGNGDESK